MVRFKLNVSGTIFEFDQHILPDSSKLATLCNRNNPESTDVPAFVNRPAKCFSAILCFYQTGELHIPLDVCPGSFAREMEYWQIDRKMLTECCAFKLNSFLDESETRRKFLKETIEILPQYVKPVSRDVRYIKWRIWSIMDYQENSAAAKVYFVFIGCVILLSILSLAFSTMGSMRRPLTKCEVLEYLDHSDHQLADDVMKEYAHLDCDRLRFRTDDYDYMHSIFEEGAIFNDAENGSNVTVKLGDMTVPFRVFVYIDLLLLMIFSIDILLRMITCPSIFRYFLSIVNIVDAIAILTSYVYLTLLYIEREHRYVHSWLHILNYFQVFRSLRFLRVIRKVRASQVLVYSLKRNLNDIAVLFSFLFFSVSTFACIFYFTEERKVIHSIPNAWYLTIITLTTVGFGDVLPETTAGLIIASICAVTGIILLAITVPIFVNNFLTLYQYSVIADFADRGTGQEKDRGIENNHGDAANAGDE